MEEVKPIITEEQAAAIRQAIGEAFRPLADAAAAIAKDLGEHFGGSVRRAAAAITAGLPKNDEEPPASHEG